ncbi:MULTISPECIES: hypothetical protein [unclassified Pseudomonas]|uniref:hypothetical protein n=1 Tax=unclassified Pseudomonas TaxID=196821 RepID=UPI002448DAD4|nr:MULTISPECIES: hypothetical protein [unclassified Pseudomonas]MDH0304486.1 hypothetical protein [Pseudomonas sp. GD04091]MDH1985579.1 hypothetical protein [Pseudomonas sp. GD03689]
MKSPVNLPKRDLDQFEEVQALTPGEKTDAVFVVGPPKELAEYNGDFRITRYSIDGRGTSADFERDYNFSLPESLFFALSCNHQKGHLFITGILVTDELEFLPAASRLKDNGDPDTTFGNGGMIYFRPALAALEQRRDTALLTSLRKSRRDLYKTMQAMRPLQTSACLADGGYLIFLGDLGLAMRLNINGQLDESFGTGGYFIPEGFELQVGALQDDGFILAGIDLHEPSQAIVARYDQNGRLDKGFGPDGNGRVRLDLGAADRVTLRGIAQNRLTMTIVGHTLTGAASTAFICRLKTNGGQDPTFNHGKPVFITPPERNATLGQIALTKDERICCLGHSTIGDIYDPYYLCVMLRSDGSPDLTFSNTGWLMDGKDTSASAMFLDGLAWHIGGTQRVPGIQGTIGMLTGYLLAAPEITAGGLLRP